MDLSTAMRFCITQAQKEAAGNEVKTEHLFLGLLELDRPQQQRLPEDEVRAVKKILAKYGVHSGRDGDKLRELLRTERQSAEGDIPSLLADVIVVCQQQGKAEVSAASMLELILQSPTALIRRAVRRRTKIYGITFRGGPLWAAIQYFFIALLIPLGLLAFIEFQWQAMSSPQVTGTLLVILPWLILCWGAWFSCFGIVSLVRMRYRALACFLSFVSCVALVALAVRASLIVPDYETVTMPTRIFACVFTLGALIVSLLQLSQISSSRSEVLNTSVLKLHGTPGVLFFSYLLRIMILPIIVAGIFWIFSLPVNSVWKAIFSIYGFLLLYEAVYTTLKCLKIKFILYMPRSSHRAAFVVIFLQLQCRLWFLPLAGWFLMWYFGWFPMAAWLHWMYGIYITLISIYNLFYLLSGEKR
jgi:hypothetical protein